MYLVTVDGVELIFILSFQTRNIRDRVIQRHIRGIGGADIAYEIARSRDGRVLYTRYADLENRTLREVLEGVRSTSRQVGEFLAALAEVGIFLGKPAREANKGLVEPNYFSAALPLDGRGPINFFVSVAFITTRRVKPALLMPVWGNPWGNNVVVLRRIGRDGPMPG